MKYFLFFRNRPVYKSSVKANYRRGETTTYLKKQRNRTAMKHFTILVLNIFVLGIAPFGHTADNLNPGKEEAILANNMLLTVKLAELDIPPEEKVELLGNALGWDVPQPQAEKGQLDAITAATSSVCNQYLLTALLLDVIDTSVPLLTIVTSLYYLSAVLCYLGVI